MKNNYTIRVTTTQGERYNGFMLGGYELEQINRVMVLACRAFGCPLNAIVKVEIEPLNREVL